MASLKYWLWLTTRPGVDTAGALTVLDHFVTPEQAYYADAKEFEYLPLTPAAREGLRKREWDVVETILGDCERLNVRIMTIGDGDYPDRLRQIADPPVVLYIRGRTFHFDEEPAIAVVGSRNPSNYGQMAAGKFGMELAAGGALVVSGIAQGVDCLAIKGALNGGGKVVSVLAGGVDVPYPLKNRYLYEDVATVGALVSEYPPGSAHLPGHFPIRNRILSGLCLGVLAVECQPNSGTMLTVRHAIEQSRDVFAVPGPIDAPMSAGTNQLIRSGAQLVTCGQDILEEYQLRFPSRLSASIRLKKELIQARLFAGEQEHPSVWSTPPTKKKEKASPTPAAETSPAAQAETPEVEVIPKSQQKDRFTDDELAILTALAQEEGSADQVVERTGIPARRVLSALTMLQVQGAVEEQPGRRFRSLVQLET